MGGTYEYESEFGGGELSFKRDKDTACETK